MRTAGVLILWLAAGTWLSPVGALAQAAGGTMQAANEALAKHDWAKAVELLKPLAVATPKDAHVMYDLASAEDALDQASAAEASYRAAIEDDGGYLAARVALGLMLARQGRMDEAREELGKAAAIESGTDEDKALRARALRALARIDEKTRPAEARGELLAALQISPETAEDTLMAGELAERAGTGQVAAESAYRRVLAKDPDNAEATASLAHLLASERKFDAAEKLLTQGLAVHPGMRC